MATKSVDDDKKALKTKTVKQYFGFFTKTKINSRSPSTFGAVPFKSFKPILSSITCFLNA